MFMRKSVKTDQQIRFILSLIKENTDHYETQADKVNKWIKMSILSLKQTDISLLEELRDEYYQKASAQKQTAKELQKTLEMYYDNQNYYHFLNEHSYIKT